MSSFLKELGPSLPRLGQATIGRKPTGTAQFRCTGLDLVINGHRLSPTEQVRTGDIVSIFYSLQEVVRLVKPGYTHAVRDLTVVGLVLRMFVGLAVS